MPKRREIVRRCSPTLRGRPREASELGAHREAASHYARALRHAEELPPRELADLLQRRSRECYLTDEADEAIDALRRAAACYRAIGDRLKEGETLATAREHPLVPRSR